jgi:hypothetical protein
VARNLAHLPIKFEREPFKRTIVLEQLLNLEHAPLLGPEQEVLPV